MNALFKKLWKYNHVKYILSVAVYIKLISQHGCSMMNVFLLPQPPPPQDYSGDVYQYRVFLSRNDMEDVVCPASSRSLPVPAEVHSVSISAVTLYGSSPPANVPLGHSGRESITVEKANAVISSSSIISAVIMTMNSSWLWIHHEYGFIMSMNSSWVWIPHT